MKFGHAASIVALALGLASGPAAAKDWEVGFLGHYILTDADRLPIINNGWGIDADALYLYNDLEGVSVHSGWSDLTRGKKALGVEYNRWAATAGYWRYLTMPSNDIFRPYVNAGLGWAVQERQVGPVSTSDGFSADLAIGAITNADLFNAIPGLRFRFELRGDYDGVVDNNGDRGVADFKVSLGLHYIFGGGWKKKAEVMPAPVVAPPPPKAAPPPPAPLAPVEHKLEDVHFPYNKNSLTDKAKSTLDADAKEINSRMKANPQTRVEVAGHTDWIGSDAYNQALSERRAQAVKDYLVRKGIEGSKITTTAYGRSKPIADNRTDEGRALNRRAEIRTMEK
jgi:outer membrane protein OmpA-like peptidoglycan-associated protein